MIAHFKSEFMTAKAYLKWE